MRASRLLSILLLLQTRGRLTAQTLADELEVSVRTVYRDVESLSTAGVPIYADRGPAGGYQLLDGYRTRLTGMTANEAETLFLAGVPGPAAELGLGTVLAAAQLKLLAALPPELRSRAGRIRERFHLDAPGWFQDVAATPHLGAVADAVWNQQRISVRYHRWGGEVTRTLEPLGLVLKAGAWYLAASVGTQVRAYRVSRIVELEALDQRFERPEDFDLGRFWSHYSARFRTDVYRDEAQVRLSPRGIELLDLLGPVVSRAGRERAGAADADGWIETVIPIESVNHALVDLLRLGADVEVMGPRELRRRMVESSRALMKMYAAQGESECG
jgi:predicted DNA-binding transcriptional regulator YafY